MLCGCGGLLQNSVKIGNLDPQTVNIFIGFFSSFFTFFLGVFSRFLFFTFFIFTMVSVTIYPR
jgi:hypothetical protein